MFRKLAFLSFFFVTGLWEMAAYGRGLGNQDFLGSISAYNIVASGGNPVFDITHPRFAGGADPTGQTDSTTAIQSALNAGVGITWGPPGTYLISSTLIVPDHVIFAGAGRSATTIRASSSFPVSTPLIQLGTTNAVFGTRLENLYIDCNDVTGSVGVYSTRVNELSGLVRCSVIKFKGAGIQFDLPAPVQNVAQNFLISDIELLASSGATGSVKGVILNLNNTTIGAVRNLSIGAVGLTNLPAGSIAIALDGCRGEIGNLHIERFVTGVDIGLTTPCVNIHVHGVTGGPNVTDLTVIENTSGQLGITATGLNPQGATNTLRDARTASPITITSNVMFYPSGNVQTFTPVSAPGSGLQDSATWNKPDGPYTTVIVTAIGAGGGGGAGGMVAAGTVCTGGAGGGSGALVTIQLPFSALGATENVKIGVAGAKASGRNTAGNGADGSAGGNSQFGTTIAALARGGGGGGGGQNSGTASTAGAAASAGTTNGGTGGIGQSSGGTGAVGGNAATSAGGGGGGITAGTPGITAAGGASGATAAKTAVAGGPAGNGTGGGQPDGTSGTNWPSSEPNIGGGGGGGGSESDGTHNGGNGGNGATYGGGGGGGGAARPGGTTGNGGNGGDGVVVVSCY